MLSVIIPTYNRAQYIAETIDSVLAQTYPNVEIIVVDDGSTDNTAEVVARFGRRVTYVWQQNSERSVTRNHGLRLSRGECVAFLDSDDCWEPDALRSMLQALRRDPALALVAVACVIVDGNRRPVQEFRPGGGVEGVLPNAFYQVLRSNLIGSPSAVLLRRRALERCGGFDENRRLIGIEDWELWARLAFEVPLCCLQTPLVRYRRHEGNSPLVAMRLQYPCLIDSLLAKLPLTSHEQTEVRKLGALRLVDYAGDFFEIKESDAVRHCLQAAARIHPPIASSAAFDQLVKQSPVGEVATGFTTAISTKEGLLRHEQVQRVLSRIQVDPDAGRPRESART
jgi:hypothetical protein